MMDLEKQFRQHRICAILRGVAPEQALDYAKALYAGGIRLFEVAVNGREAYGQIDSLRRHFGDRAYVGAGTVINRERCIQAREAGAQFFLTPSASVPTLEFCRNHQIPLLPGVMTPSDVDICLSYGFRVMKLFPAGVMPEGYIRQLKGPFNDTEYVAVGGVSPRNMKMFLAQGYIGAGIGSSLADPEWLREGRWEKIGDFIKEQMKGLEES